MARIRNDRASGRGVTWAQLCRQALALPGVVEGTSYRTAALHVGKTLLARLKEDGVTVVVRVDVADRDVLLQACPEAFFLTDHYVGHPWILVRLGSVHGPMLTELLKRAWALASTPPRKHILTQTDRTRRTALAGTGQPASRTRQSSKRRRTMR